MNEKGFMIDKSGNLNFFGVDMEKIERISSSVSEHQLAFIHDIVDTDYFKSLAINYDMNKTIYTNAIFLSLQGIVLGFNHQLNPFAPTQLTSYVPQNPTIEQIKVIEENQDFLDSININKLYEFHSEYWEDCTEYNSFKSYIKIKKKVK